MSEVTLVVGDEKMSGDEPDGSSEMRAASSVSRLPAHAPQTVPSSASLDTQAFRRTMSLLATGVTVITTRMNGSIHGITASAVTSVSLDPLLMLVAINRRTSMRNIIQQSGEFAINILSERQEELSRHFAGSKTGPQAASLRFASEPDVGAPYIPDTLASIRCRVARVLDGGDHVIILGHVVHFNDGPPASPLLYFGNRYCTLRDLDAPCLPGPNHVDMQIFDEDSRTRRSQRT